VQENGHIKIASPFKASVVLLRPQMIYELFDTYSFALFHKNIRNPLLESQFNEEIEKTALDNAPYFWYYNNGITAITSLLPVIGNIAESIELTGLQIINGAQTVYAIYHAYKNASPTKRKIMDGEIFVTLRLISSHSADFNLNVTRYTNSQNPVDDRDFCANDYIQIRLQNESFNTNVWYEKRRGEFRELPKNIMSVSNEYFADAYLAYHLQDPVCVLKKHNIINNENKNINFISYKNHKEGVYEKIFNEKTTFEDMLCSFYIFSICIKFSDISYDNMIRNLRTRKNRCNFTNTIIC